MFETPESVTIVSMVAFRGHFDGKVIVPDEPVDLPRGQALMVHLLPVSEGEAATLDHSDHVLDWVVDNLVAKSELPEDGSIQHDHYLYGTSKRKE